ncbi:MAG: hypothetical protein MMC23_005432 [Stictis urceolatum]|nr:hypothetical protein [Stictis urceolata]
MLRLSCPSIRRNITITKCSITNARSYAATAKSKKSLSIDLPPSDPHAPHNSLATFLSHASRTGLSARSTVYNGTYYEYVCQTALEKLGFKLTRVGGRSDAGIDLIGTWQLPSQPFPLRCIVQCKALSRKLGPNLVREIEGAFNGAPAAWRGDKVVGVLCSTKPATKGVRDAIRDSGRGVVWVLVEGKGANEGMLRQAVWNQGVADLGAQGVDVGVLYIPSKKDGAIGTKESEEPEQEIRLKFKGEVWTPPKSKDMQREPE